jgi:hypothetical protein
MSALLIPFPRVPVRAFVVVPDAEVTRDICRVVPGGYAIDGELPWPARGRLSTVLFELRADPRGLPVTVHPECKRRAGQ